MDSDSRRRLRQKALVVAIGGLLAMLALATAGPAAAITEPDADSFYDAPANIAAKSPGTILRQRSVTTRGLGIPLPVRTTQMLVRSTNAKGQPTTVVTTLMVPLTWSFGKRPLLSYQPAIDSLGDQCNPSYTLRTGLEKELPLMAMGLLKGWAVVVTDYQGPNDAFAAGRMEGQGVLDGIRAAQKLSTARLSGTKVGLWGYSGGGLASGWAAELAPSYAPELKIVGLAAGGMPSDLQAAGLQMDEGPFAGLFLAAAVGLSREYPELLAILNPRGMKLIEAMDDMCLIEEVASGLFKKLRDHTTVPDPLHDPVVTNVLDLNKMGVGASAPRTPVFLYHSAFDELIPYSSAQAVRGRWCRNGTRVKFKTDYLSEHNILAVTGGPAAVAYLADRFRGATPPSNC